MRQLQFQARQALANPQVEVVQSYRADPHKHFAGTRRWCRHVDDLEVLYRSMLIKECSLHQEPIPCAETLSGSILTSKSAPSQRSTSGQWNVNVTTAPAESLPVGRSAT